MKRIQTNRYSLNDRGNQRQTRRGVTLLFVISTIVLFLLLSASFLLMSGQYRRAVISESRLETRRDDARTLVNRAFYDLFREPILDNRFSPLRGHSILGDMYGYGAILDRAIFGVDPVTNVAAVPNSGNQLLQLTLQNQFQNILYRDNADRLGNFSLLADTYNGMLLTYITIDGEIVTSRIVDYVNNVFTIVPSRNGLGSFKLPTANRIQKVIINNRAFAGTGAGVVTNTPSHQAALTNENRPNRVGESRFDFVSNYALRNGNANHRATNEEHDALDFQNMFLAKPEIALAGPTLSYTSANAFRSFHRPNMAGPLFDVAGTGDPTIDNDGDGVADGFWMDIDLPLQTDVRGRVFKPLVSYLVLDMDGRLNLNAHGNYAQIPANNQFKTALPLLYGGTSISTGQGFGPHEISLLPLLPVAEVLAVMQGNGTWVGRYGVDQVPGGLGRDAASAMKLFSHPVAAFASGTGGLTGNFFFSPMDIHGRLGFGSANTFSATLPINPYNPTGPTVQIPVGLPVADIQTSTLADEITNSPLEMNFGRAPFAPAGNSADTPFTAAEMESVLRLYDFDTQMLPPRLRQLLVNSLSTSSPNVNVIRHLLTTDSYEVPVPPQSLVEKLQTILRTQFPVDADLNAQVQLMLGPDIRLGLRMDVNRPFGNGIDDGVTSAVPPRRAGVVDEFGEAFVNPGEQFPDPYGRAPFYVDPDNDGVTGAAAFDDFARYNFARHLYVVTLLTTQWFDRNGDGLVDINTSTPSDWFEYDFLHERLPLPPALDEGDVYAYRRDVAQWVANVVDFRDPDSIMSVFEFDLNPWDGWGVDGNPATDETVSGVPPMPALDRFVVVGTERPELLLTESLAVHVRKTEDRDDEVPNPSSDTPALIADGDPDRDQRFVPTSAVFLELYNPYLRTGNAVVNRNNDIFPQELYGNVGVDLRRTSVDGSSPVWRLRFVKSTTDYHATAQLNIDDLELNPNLTPPVGPNPFNPGDVVRVVYFQPPTDPALLAEYPNRIYFPDTALTIPQVAPGGYAVVGSSGVETAGNFRTYMGRRTTPTWTMELGDTRHINLIPGSSQVQVRFWNTATSAWQTSARRAVAVPVGRRYNAAIPGGEPRSLGISDPVDGYAQGTITLSPVPDGFEFFDSDPGVNTAVTLDIPADDRRATGDLSWENIPNTKNLAAGLRDDGLIAGAYVVHLQRLANPLRPYDQRSNPYITIDALGVDLNVFNGLSNDPEPDAAAALNDYFASFERGTNESDPVLNYPGNSNARLTFWHHDQSGRYTVPGTQIPVAATAGDSHHYSFNVINSLGQVDQSYRVSFTANDPGIPWLNWNNRPYASALELANVPYTSPYQMLSRFGVYMDTKNAYQGQRPTDIAAPYNNSQFPRQSGQFNHLFSFHTDSISNNPANPSGAPALHKVFDYLEVPSRFAGLETYVNPNTAQFAANLGFSATYPIPSFRAPGKINLNTADETAYRGMLGNNYSSIVLYNQFDASRRLNPYRAAENANLVGATFTGEIRSAAPTLFRPQTAGSNFPMFDLQGTALGVGAHNTPDRSAYFRYDMRQRLGNMVTYRSSVFAVWVTVGFFEVDPVSLQPQLNREVGLEEGQVQRYRGFYLVDRSIPVAFEPGFNHNTDQAILSSSITEHAIKRD